MPILQIWKLMIRETKYLLQGLIQSFCPQFRAASTATHYTLCREDSEMKS